MVLLLRESSMAYPDAIMATFDKFATEFCASTATWVDQHFKVANQIEPKPPKPDTGQHRSQIQLADEQSKEDNDFLNHLRSLEKENRRVITEVEIQKLELEHNELVINYFVYHEQTGLVADYENSFLELKRWAEVWNKEKFDEKWVVSIFVSGLKEEIKEYVKLCCPDSLHRAIVLAKWRELSVADKVFDKRAEQDTTQDGLQLGKLIEVAKVTSNIGKEVGEESATNCIKEDIGYLISFNAADNLNLDSIKLDNQASEVQRKVNLIFPLTINFVLAFVKSGLRVFDEMPGEDENTWPPKLNEDGLYWGERGKIENTKNSFYASHFFKAYMLNSDYWVLLIDCEFLNVDELDMVDNSGHESKLVDATFLFVHQAGANFGVRKFGEQDYISILEGKVTLLNGGRSGIGFEILTQLGKLIPVIKLKTLDNYDTQVAMSLFGLSMIGNEGAGFINNSGKKREACQLNFEDYWSNMISSHDPTGYGGTKLYYGNSDLVVLVGELEELIEDGIVFDALLFPKNLQAFGYFKTGVRHGASCNTQYDEMHMKVVIETKKVEFVSLKLDTRKEATWVLLVVLGSRAEQSLKGKEKPKSSLAPAISIEDLFTSINRHVERSEYEQVVKVVDQDLSVNPGDEDVIRCKILALIMSDKIDEAVSIVKKVPQGFSFFKAYCLCRQNKLDEALESLKGLIGNSATMLLESQILFRLWKMDLFVDIYRKLKNAKTDLLEINVVAGLISVGRASEVQGMMEVLKVKPTSSFELAYNVACSLIERQKYTDVEQLLLSARRNCQVYAGYFFECIKITMKIWKQSTDIFEKFVLEIETLIALQSKNIISMFGFCLMDNKLFLVYDFLQKESFKDNLHGRNVFGWSERYKVIVVIAICSFAFQEFVMLGLFAYLFLVEVMGFQLQKARLQMFSICRLVYHNCWGIGSTRMILSFAMGARASRLIPPPCHQAALKSFGWTLEFSMSDVRATVTLQ